MSIDEKNPHLTDLHRRATQSLESLCCVSTAQTETPVVRVDSAGAAAAE
jgi:hypothetical protein